MWKEVNYGQMSEKEKQLIVSEVNILRELRHPHIVRYLDRVIDKQATKIYIVMEYCEGGDLSQYIKRKKREGCVLSLAAPASIHSATDAACLAGRTSKRASSGTYSHTSSWR